MPFRGYALRMLSFFALALLITAIPLARRQGQEVTSMRGPSFLPDGSFLGSTLAEWHTLGQAN